MVVDNILNAAAAIKEGGVIIYPSETSYGFTCDATNKKPIDRIYSLKGRESVKPFIVLMKDIEQAREYLRIPDKAAKLSALGGLSIIVRNKSLGYFKDKVAFRIPAAHPVSMKLLEHSQIPLVTTSANLSGQPPIYKIGRIESEFSGKVDFILNAGNLPESPLTTVYEPSSGKIIRQGAVTMADINNCLGIA